MKKILSLTLIICTLLFSCLIASSCSAVNAVEADPTQTISEALSSSFSDFFESDVGLVDVIDNISDKSSLQIYFESEDLLGGDLTKVGATFYSDLRNNQFVVNAEAKYNDSLLSANLFTDKNGLALNGASLLGSDKSYKLNYETFVKKLTGSDLAEMLGMEQSDIDELVKLMTEFKEQINTSAKKNVENITDFGDQVCLLFEQELKTETISINGEEVKSIVVSYKIKNDGIKKVFLLAYDTFLADLDENDETKQELNEFLNELDKNCSIDITATLCLDKKADKILKLGFDGKITTYSSDNGEQSSDLSTFGASITFLDNKIAFEATINDGDDNMSLNATLEKKTQDDSVVYELKIEAGKGSVYIDIVDAKLEFKKDKTFELSAGVMKDSENNYSYNINVNGTYDITKNKAAFEFTSVKMDNITVKFKLGIVIDANPEIPAVPNDALDIMDLKKEDLEKLLTDFQSSDIFKIFAQMGQTE